jgi:hypothetical protein
MASFAARPRTNVGLWLQAIFLRQHERRDALRPTLNGGRPGWNEDEPAVIEAVFELVMARLFLSVPDARSVTGFAGQVHAVMEATPPVDIRNAEALIRRALGEADADVSGIGKDERFVLQGLLAGSGVLVMGIRDEATVNEIVAEGERIAFGRGRKPPLARDNKLGRVDRSPSGLRGPPCPFRGRVNGLRGPQRPCQRAPWAPVPVSA